MKCLILAAGYGTRLHPLTEKLPKPLLEVGGRPMIEHILGRVEKLDRVDEICIVHNERFAGNFRNWAQAYASNKIIRLFNDGSTDDSNKLGAIGDMRFAVEEAGIDDDMLVIAGDNLFGWELSPFVEYFDEKGTCAALYRVADRELIKKYSVVELDENGRIVSFEEKPADPATDLAAICLYLLGRGKLRKIGQYIGEGRNPDAPGYFIKYLAETDIIHGIPMEGDWLDIGDFKSLEEAERLFGRRGPL